MTSDLIDETLTARLARTVGPGGVRRLRRLTGGFSSLTYQGELNGEGVVIKVAPPGRSPTGNRDVLRQARILQLLHAVPDVPVPPVLFTDPGEPPDIPPLFAMSLVDGDCVEPLAADGGTLPTPDVVDARARGLAQVLASLHRHSPSELGLASEPVTAPQEESQRWLEVFRAVRGSARALELGERLCASAPESAAPAVLHGDFRLGNSLCREMTVTAVIDWEIWSIGDPRTDLAWMLMRAAPQQLHTSVREAPGMPTANALLREYEICRRAPVSDLSWFGALARYKYTAIVADLARRCSATRAAAAVIAAKADGATLLLNDIDRLLQEYEC